VFERLFNYPTSEFRFGELIYLRDWPLVALFALWLLGAALLIVLAGVAVAC